ncbi:MAG TPA: hypothetical protein VFQ91_18780 [Bryobacteraceae bacterium]|nr:hypothetical protein [Bryobacteraceae bacterium]
MSFKELIPHEFTSGSARCYAPMAPGVYGISNAREWIYIGQADGIQAALLGHLEALNMALIQRLPSGFVFEICSGNQRQVRQDRLVQEYVPILNQRLTNQSQSALRRRQTC